MLYERISFLYRCFSFFSNDLIPCITSFEKKEKQRYKNEILSYNILQDIPLGGFFSEIILGAIVGYVVVLIVPIFSKITKIFKK